MKKWLKRLFYNTTYKLMGLKCGPVMFQIRGHYFYLDPYGQLWRVTPTFQHDMPLTISIVQR